MQQQLTASSYVHSITGAPFGHPPHVTLPPSMLALPGGSGGVLTPIAIPATPAEFPLVITDPGPGLIHATNGGAVPGQADDSENSRRQPLDPFIQTVRAVDSEANNPGSE